MRIPKTLAEAVPVAEGTCVDLTVEADRLVICPVNSAAYDLDSLLAQVTPENIHGEIGLDTEAW